MRFRIAFAALALAAAGCNEPCKGENVDVIQDTVPASCPGMAGSAVVTVSFEVCVRCNDATPSCQVDAQGGGFLLDPIAEACESGSSCPIPSCGLGEADRRTVSCTLMTPASGTVNLMVYDVGQATTIPVTLTVGGSDLSC
jgi:hypothetical protein